MKSWLFNSATRRVDHIKPYRDSKATGEQPAALPRLSYRWCVVSEAKLQMLPSGAILGPEFTIFSILPPFSLRCSEMSTR